MMKILTIALLLCGPAFAKLDSFRNVLTGKAPLTQDALNSMYTSFKAEFADPEVERFLLARGGDRRAIFEANVRDIVAHNSARDQTWQKGINAFSEMSDDEFVQYYGIIKKDQVCTVAPPEGAKKQGLKVNLPDRWDWRDFGVVTPPKNQG